MTELAHSNEHGGLMAKSVGEIYPLMVSALGSGLWYLHNGETGKASLTLYTSSKAPHARAKYTTPVMARELSGMGIDEVLRHP